MKKVGIIVSDITLRAGTERAVISLANMLTTMGAYKVKVFSLYSSQKKAVSFTVNDNIILKHLCMPEGSRMIKMRNYAGLLKIIKQEIQKEGLDYIVGTVTAYNILITFLSADKCKKIGCEHVNYHCCTRFMRILRKMRYQYLDKLVLLTQADKEKYFFLDNKRKRVIPNSLPISRDGKSKLTNKKIISIGRLSKEKGYDLLLKMAEKLKKRLPDWHIDVYGEGELRHELETYVLSHGLWDFVTFCGETTDVKKKLTEASIYWMTSRTEGMGIVLIEAQACGLPIVAFDCEAGPREIIEDNINGFLVKPFDRKQFVEKTVKLARNQDLRIRFGNAGYNSCRKYEAERIFLLWDKLFSLE